VSVCTTADDASETTGTPVVTSLSGDWASWLAVLSATGVPAFVLVAWYPVQIEHLIWSSVNVAMRRGDLLVPALSLCIVSLRRGWCLDDGIRSRSIKRKLMGICPEVPRGASEFTWRRQSKALAKQMRAANLIRVVGQPSPNGSAEKGRRTESGPVSSADGLAASADEARGVSDLSYHDSPSVGP